MNSENLVGDDLNQMDSCPGKWKHLDMIKTRNRYRNYLTIEAFVILLVVVVFRTIESRPVAALIASSLFLISSLAILGWELRQPGYYKRSSFWGFLIFIIFSVLPIMGMRLWNWGLPWDQVSLFGFSGPQWHEASNKIFLMVMICLFADSYLETKRTLSEKFSGEEGSTKN